MVELQVLNKLLKERSFNFLTTNGVTEEYFLGYREEYLFILDHFNKYGNVPDTETFLLKFQDFQLINVSESTKYLIEQLQEQYLYSKLVPFVNGIAERVRDDSKEALDYARTGIESINKLVTTYKEGYDIVANALERFNEYEQRMNVNGLLGITTGIPELDDITHGWLKEDLITIIGRTNEGKTWVLLYFLIMAWKAGKKVLLYSGEMSSTVIGFRFDTLNHNFSNEGLMHGQAELGMSEKPLNTSDYINYLNSITKSGVPFIVVTPKDIGGKKLDIQTLHSLIEKYQPDIVGLDQLSLMEDARSQRNEPERLKYTHLAEDLYLTSEKYSIPIISPVQASRESVKNNKAPDASPELHQIAESDGVAQNSTRVISIKQLGSTMKLSIKKNRYGKNNIEILLIWDIDKGIVKPFLQVDQSKGSSKVTYQPGIGEELF